MNWVYRTTKKRISQLLTEIIVYDSTIIPIRQNHPPHLDSKQIDEVTKIASNNEFHLGIKEIAHQMQNHSDETKKIDINPATIRKCLKKQGFIYSRLKYTKSVAQ